MAFSRTRALQSFPCARSAEAYRRHLYPDLEEEGLHFDGEALAQFVAATDEHVMDVGCGMTYRNPYSLINRVLSIREKMGLKGTFEGIDPNIEPGTQDGQAHFHIKQRIRVEVESLLQQFWRIHFTGYPIETATPGKAAVRHGYSHETGAQDASQNTILSDNCFPLWVPEHEVLRTLEEFHRILAPDGVARLYPMGDRDKARIEHKGFLRNHFDVRYCRPAFDKFLEKLSDAFAGDLVILRKK